MKAFRFLAICLVLSLSLLFMACEKEGPAERAGERADEAYEDTMENLGDARDNIKDKINPAGPMEQAGEEMDEAVEDIRN